MKKIKTAIAISTFALIGLGFSSCNCLKNTTNMNEQSTSETAATNGRKPAPFQLDNTKWELVRIDAQDRPFVPTDENKQIILTFAEGNMNTSDGCNSLGAEYKQDKYQISFGMFRSTRAYCPPEYMEKNGYMVAFGDVKEFYVENERILYFFDKNGKRLATYQRIAN